MRGLALPVAALLLGSCNAIFGLTAPPSGEGPIDAPVPDAGPDGVVSDGGPDGMGIDAMVIDGVVVDSMVVDAMVDAMPDARPVDAMVDAPPPDAMVDAPPDAYVDPCRGTGMPDEDGDGLANSCDLCPLISSPVLTSAQADSDGDQVGDACDPKPNQAGDHLAFISFDESGLSATGWTLDPLAAWAGGGGKASWFGNPTASGSIRFTPSGTVPSEYAITALTRIAQPTQDVGRIGLQRISGGGVHECYLSPVDDLLHASGTVGDTTAPLVASAGLYRFQQTWGYEGAKLACDVARGVSVASAVVKSDGVSGAMGVSVAQWVGAFDVEWIQVIYR